jgi:CRISPR-associated endonuclease/helicase Cas3
MLRHLGLAGKVVILDEIHAYDAYMNSYLTRVLTWLGAYSVPVLALSATLPAERRRALLAAYRRGQQGRPADSPVTLDGDIGYPALTWTAGEQLSTRAVAASGRCTSVRIDALADELDQWVVVLRDALSDGGTALIVCNTVRRVLAAGDRLAQEFPGEVTVTHSRFIIADRMRKDVELLDAFGAPNRALHRPHRHIVVASQVVEQSLDVDFDLMITDLSPVDLVLQRMGRLHRHQRGEDQQERPPKLRRARAYITGADFTQGPPVLEPASARHVYGAHALLRAAAVLQPRFGASVELPTDIAPLVQTAYGPEDIGPAEWRQAMDEAQERWRVTTARRQDAADAFQIRDPTEPGKAIIGWVAASVGDTDDEAQGQGQVRDGAPTLEVLLVYHDSMGQWRTPRWLGPESGWLPIPQETTPPDGLAEVMASCALRLPLQFSNADTEEQLWQATPESWEQSPVIYRIPVLVVDEQGWGEINGRRVRYTPDRGLEVFDRDQ